VPRYARMVPTSEIADPANDYNLNIPRYIDSSEPEDLHDLDAHLNGGIPDGDIDMLADTGGCFPRCGANSSRLPTGWLTKITRERSYVSTEER
jgi:type I restriction enzyme M protein